MWTITAPIPVALKFMQQAPVMPVPGMTRTVGHDETTGHGPHRNKPVMAGTADVLPVTVTGSYAKLGHFNLWLFPHSGYVPVTAEAEQAYQVEHYPLCGPSPHRARRNTATSTGVPPTGDDIVVGDDRVRTATVLAWPQSCHGDPSCHGRNGHHRCRVKALAGAVRRSSSARG